MKIQQKFDNIAFQGHFRDFQRQLLKKVDDILDNSRINLITAPGSDKKLLGLEIIRRMASPALLISATPAGLSSWCETFRYEFFPEERRAEADGYLSSSLRTPALITAITYDVLQAAVNRTAIEDEDFSSLDIIRLVQDCGIRTVCLDEPHHLSDSHTKALETLLGVLGGEIHVLSLSSVPPYDLNSRDWERFTTLFGEINEEIFTPELVKAGILCPHQDYVYFNYPSAEESAGILGYRLRADKAVEEAMKLGFFAEVNRRVTKLYHKDLDFLYNHYDEMLSLIILLAEYGYSVHRKIIRMMTRSNELPPASLQNAQIAFNFLLESQTILRDTEKEELLEVFRENRVTEHHHVSLSTTQKIRRTLVSSLGKLESLAAITEAESLQQGEELRELIVTDEVESDSLQAVDAHDKPIRITPLTVFDTLRTRCPQIPGGCLTRNAAVLPGSAAKRLTEAYGLPAGSFTLEPLGTTGYAAYTFTDSIDAVRSVVVRLLADGIIRILITTEKVLGEECHISCVNTLIPICSVSSYVAIPRIRGNMILTDRDYPNKTVHIWHIATVEKEYSLEENPTLRLASRLSNEGDTIRSVDYEALCRRFSCFIAPNETDGELETGIDRLTQIRGTYDAEGFKAINEAIVASAADRKKLKSTWKDAMAENTRPVAEVIVPKAAKVPVFALSNLALILVAIAAGVFVGAYAYVSVALLVITFARADLFFYAVMLVVLVVLALLLAVFIVLYLLPWFINHLLPMASINSLCRALLRALKEQGEINKRARFIIEPTANKSGYRIYLDDSTAREQTVYQEAVAEMLSPIHKPNYIMVRSGMIHSLRWLWSYACPEIISHSDVAVKIFEKHLRMSMGLMKFQFTQRDPGRKYLIIARNKSYINLRDVKIEKRLHVLKHDRF